MKEKIESLKEKLKNVNINFEEKLFNDPDLRDRLTFLIPAGRDNFPITFIYREEYLDNALKIDFERYKFIAGYEAIWSKDFKIIEAEITNIDYTTGRFFFNRLSRLMGKSEVNEDEENISEITEIKFPNIGDLEISLSYSSKEFSFLSVGREKGSSVRNIRRITLKISNANLSTHEGAKDLLEKIANSIFFQIDLTFEIAILLQPKRKTIFERRSKRQRKLMNIEEGANFKEPKYEYDNEPMSLYWYAKESENMPIFQFLAFYQAIEFYFPIYSSLDAKQKIQSLIKDPRFNPNKDSDITKIISTIKLSSSGKSFGNEREQLKSTINACTDNNELIEFLKADEKRFNFYSENKGKKLSAKRISVKNDTADFVTEIMERIYEVRCRIVHTKSSDGTYEALLPYSSEVNELNFDIELIEFLSRKVLINSSRQLKI